LITKASWTTSDSTRRGAQTHNREHHTTQCPHVKPVTPLPWQTTPIAQLTSAIQDRGAALDASDTGVGKTFQALFVAFALRLAVGVVCPKSVIPAWREACDRVGACVEFIENVESLKAGSPHLTRVGKNWSWALRPGVLLIFDEVHRFSAPNSQNARILAAAPRPLLMLSATAAGDPTKMRAIGHQLGLCGWSDWWSWCGRHGCRRGRFGGLEFRGTQGHLLELHRQIFDAGLGVRVRIPDLPPGAFPSNRIETVLVPVANQRAISQAYRAELGAKKAHAPAAITELLRCRQIVEHEKLPAIIELTQDLIDSGTSAAVFVNFRESLDQVQRMFNAAVIHGDQTAAEREAQIRAFQIDESHVVVSMIQAGGVGISLHDVNGSRPRVSIICPGWSAIELRQALGRIHRATAKSPALQKIVFADGTIDEHIRTKVEAKLANLDALNDGDLTPNESTQ
jgi:hypothetical protein